jgi:hypothetical protein
VLDRCRRRRIRSVRRDEAGVIAPERRGGLRRRCRQRHERCRYQDATDHCCTSLLWPHRGSVVSGRGCWPADGPLPDGDGGQMSGQRTRCDGHMSPLALMSGDSSDRGHRSALHRHLRPPGRRRRGANVRVRALCQRAGERAIHSAFYEAAPRVNVSSTRLCPLSVAARVIAWCRQAGLRADAPRLLHRACHSPGCAHRAHGAEGPVACDVHLRRLGVERERHPAGATVLEAARPRRQSGSSRCGTPITARRPARPA